MDDNDSQVNTGSDEPAAESTQMLPPLNTDDEDAANDEMTVGDTSDPQTVPIDRALVPTPEEAADSDLIEKEWVMKAKQIVEHTAEDPYKQQEELSKIKADYMKKRYNKDIGLG